MYRRIITHETEVITNDKEISEGETIEMMIERMQNNNESADTTAPMLYTSKKDGVIPEYDIRTDKFEMLIEAKDKLTSKNITKEVEAKKAEQQTLQEAAGKNKQSEQEQ